jgi:hypothetical protein
MVELNYSTGIDSVCHACAIWSRMLAAILRIDRAAWLSSLRASKVMRRRNVRATSRSAASVASRRLFELLDGLGWVREDPPAFPVGAEARQVADSRVASFTRVGRLAVSPCGGLSRQAPVAPANSRDVDLGSPEASHDGREFVLEHDAGVEALEVEDVGRGVVRRARTATRSRRHLAGREEVAFLPVVADPIGELGALDARRGEADRHPGRTTACRAARLIDVRFREPWRVGSSGSSVGQR